MIDGVVWGKGKYQINREQYPKSGILMRHGSLFSGGGGFDLAAEWMGWENSFHVEINPFGRQILKYYWPKAVSYEDIKTTDFNVWRGRIDVLSGGFPCQPFSNAGKRGGTTDDRFLWPEYLRAIREIQPTWVTAENVPGILSIERGMVFEAVCADLEAEGYEVQPIIIPSVATGADHKRERVFFIAHRNDTGDGTSGCRTSRSEQEIVKDGEQSQFECSRSFNADQYPQCDGWANIGSKEESGIRQQRNIEPRDRERIYNEPDNTNPNCFRCVYWKFEKQSTEGRKYALNESARCFENDTDTNNERLERRSVSGGIASIRQNRKQHFRRQTGHYQSWLEAATRLCFLPNVISGWMDRNIRRLKIEDYASKVENLSKQDLPSLWERVQSQQVWEKIRRCDQIQKQEVLLAIMRKLKFRTDENWLSAACQEISETGELFQLWYDRTFGDSSYKRGLERQFSIESESIMSQLSHEIALDGVEIYSKVFVSKWRTESLKVAGNAVDPDVVYEIFLAISAASDNTHFTF